MGVGREQEPPVGQEKATGRGRQVRGQEGAWRAEEEMGLEFPGERREQGRVRERAGVREQARVRGRAGVGEQARASARAGVRGQAREQQEVGLGTP